MDIQMKKIQENHRKATELQAKERTTVDRARNPEGENGTQPASTFRGARDLPRSGEAIVGDGTEARPSPQGISGPET